MDYRGTCGEKKMTTSAIRKIVQNLCKQRYIVKFGTTKSAFYRKMD